MQEIPSFPYHPDPFATGVVVGADEQCECCKERRTLFYVGPFYAAEEVEKLCLWCVADGSAAEKYDGLFVDDINFEGEDVTEDAIEQVTRRTPSFRAWQQEQWLVHCQDACEFHGNPTIDELRDASDEVKEDWSKRYDMGLSDWPKAIESESAGFYKFACKHCDKTFFAFDYS